MIHIHNFIDKIKFFESSNSKDFIITIREAKDLHGDITKLLTAIHELQNKIESSPSNIEIDGGAW